MAKEKHYNTRGTDDPAAVADALAYADRVKAKQAPAKGTKETPAPEADPVADGIFARVAAQHTAAAEANKARDAAARKAASKPAKS